MAAGEVVGGIFLAADELLGVEELAVRAGADLIDHGGLQLQHHAARNVLARPGLAEEGIEGVVPASHRLVARHLPIRLDTVLEAEELPAGIAYLNSRLTNVDGQALSHIDTKLKIMLNSDL